VAVESYSSRLWAASQPLYQRILGHPFLVRLQDGSLAPATFAYYLEQDRLFLDLYARCLCVLASRAPTAEAVLLFSRDAADAISAEQQLESQWLAELSATPADAPPPQIAPTTLAYGSYLLSTVHREGFFLGLAAVLPCYWVYFEVGRHLARAGSSSPLYQSWIDSYSSPVFESVVQRVRGSIDEGAPRQPPDQLHLAKERFLTAVRYEWMFWDMAWHTEDWPI